MIIKNVGMAKTSKIMLVLNFEDVFIIIEWFLPII